MTIKSPLIESLSARHYTAADIFRDECNTIHKTSWRLVGPSALLDKPGNYLRTEASDISAPWVVVRNPNGELTGFENVCRHRAGPLVTDRQGKLASALLTCRYHGWSYRLNGELAAAPGLSECPKIGLNPIAVREWNGLVFANADPTRDDLASWLGAVREIADTYPALDRMTYIGTVETTGRCNWKLYGDNSCEGWHVPFIHQTLKDNAAGEDVAITCHEDGAFVLFDVRYRPSTADPTRHGQAHWIYKFPGLLLHFARHTINVETVEPLAPDRIAVRRYFWADENAICDLGLNQEGIIAASKAVMEEDMAICEQVQQNLANCRHELGYLSPEQEPGTVFFQRLVRHALESGI